MTFQSNSGSMTCCAKVVFLVSVVVGMTLIVTGVVVLVLVLPPTLEKKIHESLFLQEGNEAADRFVSSPVPSYMSFYFFNVTNKDEVNQNNAKEVFSQVGPYVYRQEKEKNISKWDEKFGTVTYKEKSTYYFEQGISKGSLDDKINHLNVIALTVMAMMKADYFGPRVFTHTVDELLFGGLDAAPLLPPPLAPICGFVIPGCKFGFYLGKNESWAEPFEVSSGFKCMKDFGEIKTYSGKRELLYWYDEHCNALNGTDGKQFPPGVDKNKGLYVFSADVCRSLKFEFEKEVTVEGIPALRYVVPSSVFADPNVNRDNMCFCHANSSAICPSKAGLMPLDECQEGKPVMASSPHFYQGDEKYWQRFGGLKPDKEQHQTFLDIEPMTGTVISAAKRIQINFRMEPDPRYPIVNITERTYFPIFWAEEGGTIDPKTAEEFRGKVLTPFRTGKWSMVACICVGGVMLLLTAILIFMKVGKNRD